MQSIKTMYRVVVMAVTIVIVVQAWKLYGPSSDQVKSLALRAVEAAEGVLKPSTEGAAETTPPAPFSGKPNSAEPAMVAPPLAVSGGNSAPTVPTDPVSEQSASGLITPISTPQPPSVDPNAGRLKDMYARLEELGAGDPQLAQWGASGELFRFCCQATWGESTQFTRHFESVAAEPLLAVQQVLAEVDAWRVAQRNVLNPR